MKETNKSLCKRYMKARDENIHEKNKAINLEKITYKGKIKQYEIENINYFYGNLKNEIDQLKKENGANYTI